MMPSFCFSGERECDWVRSASRWVSFWSGLQPIFTIYWRSDRDVLQYVSSFPIYNIGSFWSGTSLSVVGRWLPESDVITDSSLQCLGVSKVWLVSCCSCGHSESIPVTVFCRFDMELSDNLKQVLFKIYGTKDCVTIVLWQSEGWNDCRSIS